MKSFDDFLKEFDQTGRKATLKEIAEKMAPNNTDDIVSVIVNCMTAIDKIAEDRLRAYHEWMSKNS